MESALLILSFLLQWEKRGRMAEKEKLKIHTSYKDRQKQHRTTKRNISWGSGVTEGIPFSWSMLRPSFWGAWCAISLLFLLVTILPYRVLMALGQGIGLLMHKFLKGRRYVVATNLKLAFPNLKQSERDQLEKKIFANAGMAVFETGIAWFWPDWRLKRMLIIDPKELELARQLGAQDTRTIAFTCHMVTLEIGARLYALAIKPGIGIYRSSDHPVWEYIQVKGRLRSNLALIDRTDVRSMVKAVMKGYPIWYAPDQDYGRQASVFVPFFGVDKACTVTGLHDLARHLHVLPPLEDFPSEDVNADTLRGNQMVEQMILSAPEQYLWMHRRFKTAPEGEPSRYPDIA